jgi:hypothetical protein
MTPTTVADAPATSESVRTPLQERIAERAYELYLARGGAHGQDHEDWLQAEAEILAEERRGPDRDA